MADNEDGDYGGRGRDEFLVEYVVSKANDRKIFMHKQFEEVAARYWQLMRQQPGYNQSADCINYAQYFEFMRRVYKVLLPLYREAEVTTELKHQWKSDAAGLDTMDMSQFTKLIFKIVHAWAIHVDLEEYIEFLNKLYDRVIIKKIVRGGDGSVDILLPEIYTEITQEDPEAEEPENDWVSCASGESQDNNFFEYKHDEDPETLAVKQFKRKKREQDEEEEGEASVPVFSSREPFMYKEHVKFFKDEFDSADREDSDEDEETRIARRAKQRPQPNSDDTVVDVLAEMTDVFPLGYPTEQFICKTKNEVVIAYKRIREEKKKALAAMKREIMEGTTMLGSEKRAAPNEKDPGLLEQAGVIHDLDFELFSSTQECRIRTYAKIKDVSYNAIRNLLKEFGNFMIRPSFEFPRNPAAKQKATKLLSSREPDTIVNTFGYNPSLERRLLYKPLDLIIPGLGKQKRYINVNYLIEDPVYETAFRSDVQRVETNAKLANKLTEDFLREEEFCNVTTSFRETITIMLVKKFETFFTNRLQQEDPQLQERSEKIYQAESKRKEKARQIETLVRKELTETFDEAPFMKVMKGPFYELISREGIQEDDFATCAQMDLVDSANKESQRILIIGKPRAGRTTLTNKLCKQLDLVRVAVDVWIEKVLAKIKDRTENPPEEEEKEFYNTMWVPPPDNPDEEAPKIEKEWRTPLMAAVADQLMKGEGPSDGQIDDILREQCESPDAQTRGYILDVDFSSANDKNWVQRIAKNDITGGADFTHIIELLVDDEEVKHRALNMRYALTPKDPEAADEVDTHADHGKVFSKWERDGRIPKPKPKKELLEGEEEEEEEEEEEGDENKPKPFDEAELFTRICDEKDTFLEELEHYATIERPAVDDLICNLFEHTFIKLDVAGMDPDEIAATVKFRLQNDESAPLRPIGRVIQDPSGAFKDLLQDGFDPDPESETFDGIGEGRLPRQWSMWRQQDPVCLSKGEVKIGAAEFAVDYANNVFCFSNEENRNEFAKQPKKYLSTNPAMPPDYRLMMFGPRRAGVLAQAKNLSELYGWRIVDFHQIVQEKLAAIIEIPEKPANNIVTEGPCMLCLSQNELDAIKEGKPFPAWKFIPWILEFLGVPLMQKPAPPPEPEPDLNEMSEQEQVLYHAKQKQIAKEQQAKQKAEDEAAKAKADRDKARQQAIMDGEDLEALGLQESEEEIKIDDLDIDQFMAESDQLDPYKPPRIGKDGFILVGFPQTETHCQKLKEYGIEFDRVVHLTITDTEENDPAKLLGDREREADEQEDCLYDWEVEAARCAKISEQVKEMLGEDNQDSLKEVDCAGDDDRVFINIRRELDPFFLKADNQEDVKRTEELNLIPEEDPDEETDYDKRLPRSDFGDYCPVTFVKDGYMVKGDPEFEESVYQKTFRFAGEAEQKEFIFNPSKFLKVMTGEQTLPLTPPMPKIMITGVKGAGTTSQVRMICDKYKLEEMELKTCFLNKMKDEKAKRRRERHLKRGFKPLPEKEDEEDAEEPRDAELDEEEEDFEREAHEKECMKALFDAKKGLIIDGNWSGIPEETVDQPAPTLPLEQLLLDARRMPEMIIVLRTKLEKTLERCMDKQAIQDDFDKKIKKIEDDLEKTTEEERQAKRKELEDELAQQKTDAEAAGEDAEPEFLDVGKAMEEWEAEKKTANEEFLEENPDKPELETMMQEEKDKLQEMHEADEARLEEFIVFCKEKNVQIVEQVSDVSAEFVHTKLVDILKNRIRFRVNLIEREQAQALKEKEVKFYEVSHTYKPSKFGMNSPLSLYNPIKTKNFAVLYRERIYYLANADEQQKFLLEPSKYTKGVEACPNDLLIKPRVSVIGLPKSGKSTLCERIAAQTGAIHLQMEEIIEGYIRRDAIYAENLRTRTMQQGQSFGDDDLVKLLHRRLQQSDVKKNGWILENFPQTRDQAHQMAQRSILPNNVLVLHVEPQTVYKRCTDDKSFECIGDILSQRLDKAAVSLPQVAFFFQKFYNSVQSIDGSRSKWFVEDKAMASIQATLKARQQFSRDYFYNQSERRPCVMQNLNVDRCFMKASLSQYGYFCPVSWKMSKKFVSCCQSPEFTVLYRHVFYYFKSIVERDCFLRNPRNFTEKVIFSSDRNTPKRIRSYKAAELVAQEKAIMSHCPVTLKDEGKVEKGQSLLVVQFKDNRFVFGNEEKMERFFKTPGAYADAVLPVKMPPAVDPVYLVKLQQQEESITFLEQALGSIVTRGLREVGENRLKYPSLSVKETMLKLFAIFLKAENPANTNYMKEKYHKKMQTFIERCEVPEELHELADEKSKKDKKGRWPTFKEDYYNQLGAKYDEIGKTIEKERKENFQNYIK